MKVHSEDFEIDLFPEIEDVFVPENKGYEDVFFPIYSVKLSDIDERWGDETIHMIQFNEDPYNTETVKYYKDYCKDCMIAFELVDGKYKFKTDLGFFNLTDDWKDYHKQTKESYFKSKESFIKGESDFDPEDLIFGGEPHWWQSDETPLDPDGFPMLFVSEFETDRICNDSCDKKMYLFYSHKHKLVVQIYQIT
ncbi:hypothetical protein [Chondrinema litorale]|uniref:hypothetical protein n=1 Tax=Chondrinema litorale TaxID=2994555 RepID=UPI002542F5BD|nr:hypothetical protein [Chondrinema litorale]UZR96886.1 hypothetical protein OQ292_24625 [Chondrinema litorale]